MEHEIKAIWPQLKGQFCGNWAQDTARGPCEEEWPGFSSWLGGGLSLPFLLEPVGWGGIPIPGPVAVVLSVLSHVKSSLHPT